MAGWYLIRYGDTVPKIIEENTIRANLPDWGTNDGTSLICLSSSQGRIFGIAAEYEDA